MTGRGVDQVLPHSADPALYEPYVKSAGTYVRLAEEASGPIPAPVSHDWVWGDALPEQVPTYLGGGASPRSGAADRPGPLLGEQGHPFDRER